MCRKRAAAAPTESPVVKAIKTEAEVINLMTCTIQVLTRPIIFQDRDESSASVIPRKTGRLFETHVFVIIEILIVAFILTNLSYF